MDHKFLGKLTYLSFLISILAVSGCVYIPPLGRQFTEEKRVEIVIGETTKNQFIELLGEPNILKDQRFFIYETKRSQGTIWIIFAHGYTGGIIEIPIKEQHFFVLERFSVRDKLMIMHKVEESS